MRYISLCATQDDRRRGLARVSPLAIVRLLRWRGLCRSWRDHTTIAGFLALHLLAMGVEIESLGMGVDIYSVYGRLAMNRGKCSLAEPEC